MTHLGLYYELVTPEAKKYIAVTRTPLLYHHF